MLNSYKNITVSGLPGCGSTTLLDQLREALKYHGWSGFSGGEFSRMFAIEKGYFSKESSAHHDSAALPDDFERQVDYGILERLLNEEHLIIESWLSGFMAQKAPGTLKVLMTCSNDAIRLDRIVNRDNLTIEEAKANMNDRYQRNMSKWIPLYGDLWQETVVQTGKVTAEEPINFWHPALYDLVIDTYSSPKEETLKLVMDALGVELPITMEE